jgi:hypothetical protein
MVYMVTKIKLNVNKYSQDFNTVGLGYGDLAKFIIADE